MNSTSEFRPIDSLSLRGQIEERLRAAIVNGSLRPGHHLVETTIADQLQVSRAPVREALSALEREGIVTYIPRRGYFVIEFTEKDIEEIYSLRLLLEIGALRRAIERFNEKDIRELQSIVDELGQAVQEGRDQVQVSTLDLSFHELICQIANHGRLYSVWDRMRLQTWLLIGLTSKTHYERPEEPKQFHQDILDAILEKDLPKSEKLMSEHILDAQQRAMRFIVNFNNATEKEKLFATATATL